MIEKSVTQQSDMLLFLRGIREILAVFGLALNHMDGHKTQNTLVKNFFFFILKSVEFFLTAYCAAYCVSVFVNVNFHF
jgi:hypothetical protein